MHAAGITCCQRLGDIIAGLDPGSEAEAVALLGRGQRPAVSIPLAAIEDIIDASGAAPAIEALLPRRRPRRQLTARTLLTGMLLTLADRRPAHLTEVHAALTALPEADQARLGVTVTLEDRAAPAHLPAGRAHLQPGQPRRWARTSPTAPPPMTCRQPATDLLEASIPAGAQGRQPALAADWTDVESWSRPPRHGTTSAPTPRPPGGTATPTCPAPRARCSSATTCRPPP